MRQAEDVVWAAITESARRRFDYTELKKCLGASGDERVADFILFQMIEGFAENLSPTELLSKLRGDLELLGYVIADNELNALLANKEEIMSAEIHAARTALSGFAEGQSTSDLLIQIHETLS